MALLSISRRSRAAQSSSSRGSIIALPRSVVGPAKLAASDTDPVNDGHDKYMCVRFPGHHRRETAKKPRVRRKRLATIRTMRRATM